MATSPDPVLRRSSAKQELSSCERISKDFHFALANTPVFILHRNQWQCLALSYTEVLQVLRRLLSRDWPVAPRLLCVLREVMLDAERFMCQCTATHPVGHSWLLRTALKHGAVTDVIDIHLDRFLWAFSIILIGAAPILRQADQLKPGLILLTSTLAKIWGGEHAKNDLSSACEFLAAIECKEEGDTFSLAEFIQRRLSHYRQEPVSGLSHKLPAYFWIDPESMQKDAEVLGSGGCGNVHKAKWLGGHFAVKDFFYVENREVFGREAFIQAQLRHPNVLPLICYTEIPSLSKCCLVMELMEKDLRALILDRKRAGRDPLFPLLVALELMLQIAQGMEYLHSLHIMHRDLKSLNVLVSFSSENDNLDPSFTHLKVADFGVAKAKHHSTGYTTKPLGTLSWRAPEIFKEDSKGKDVTGVKYTKSADVYSFGMVCYEILTGNFPFDGKTNICKRVLKGERPALPPTCPPALSSLIKNCWNAEPIKRPSFSQICNVLRYLKASVLLQNDQCGSSASSSAYSHCLSQTLGLEFCNDIDTEFLSSMHREGIVLQPRALNIPLRMYCCEIVIQRGLKSGHKSVGFFSWIQKRRYKGDSWASLNKSTELDVEYVFDVTRFSFKTLKIATQNFSRILARGSFYDDYYGMLENGREIAVRIDHRDSLPLEELKLLSRLRHRNIVPLLGWCPTQSPLHLVYEYMPHGDLRSHLRGEQNTSFILDWQRRVEICRHLASALTYLHEDSGDLVILHRDVKPSNVLLDKELNARLVDGYLTICFSRQEAFSPESVCGTIGYIAPEYLTKNIVGPAADVYAFGVVILQLLSGDDSAQKASKLFRAFENRLDLDPMAAADKRLGGNFPQAEFRRLMSLAMACINRNPACRPRTQELAGMISGVSEPPTFPTSPNWLDDWSCEGAPSDLSPRLSL